MPEAQKSLTSISPKVPVAIVVMAILLGLAFDYLFFEKSVGISFPIMCLLVTVGLFAILQLAGRKPTWSEYWFLIPFLFFAGMLAVRASPVLAFFNVLASYAFLALLVRAASGQSFHPRSIFGYFIEILGTILYFGESTKAVSEMVAQMRVGDSKKRSVQMLLAVIVALPFLAIFLVLFSSADLVFKSSISGLADAFGGKFWAQAFLVVVVALFSAGALTVAALQKGAKAAPATSEGQEKQNLTFVVTFLSLINALFLFFIVIQVRYFFAGPEGLQGFGFTYADYVHKGFFELVAVALLSFLLLYGAEAMVVRPDGKHAAAFKWSSGLHIALVVVIILSAFRRLSLYEQAYGFTELRLYVHAFVIWLAVVFGLLMLKVVMNTEARRFSFQILVSALLGFALLNLLNPDAFVARKNLARLEATDKIDIEYLTSLSSDSLPVIVSGLGAKDQAMLTDYLTQYRNNHPLAKTPAPWQSFNFATSKAEAVMSVK